MSGLSVMARPVHAGGMRTKQYRVTLSPSERAELQQLIASGRAPARKLAHARILLKTDTPPGELGPFDAEVAAAVEVSAKTVERVRRRFVEEGLAVALSPRPSTAPQVTKLDGRGEARLIATVCSTPPDGRARWTLRLLAQHLVELAIIESISYETVRRVLKKVS
jgi:transposase